MRIILIRDCLISEFDAMVNDKMNTEFLKYSRKIIGHIHCMKQFHRSVCGS